MVESRRAFNISNGIYWGKSCFLCLVDFKNNFLVQTAETKRNCCCTIQEWIDGLFDVVEEKGLFLDKELIQWFYCMKGPVLYCKCNTTSLELKWEVHAMYSPDMIPSDCHLFHFRQVSLTLVTVIETSSVEGIYWIRTNIILLSGYTQFTLKLV